MFTVGVRASLGVAGGLRGGVSMSVDGSASGAAAAVATYDVVARLQAQELDRDGSVFDVDVLRAGLGAVIRELDSVDFAADARFEAEFGGRAPTGELLARHLHRRLSSKLPVIAGFPLIRRGTLTVSVEDTRGSFASFAAPVRGAPPPGPRR